MSSRPRASAAVGAPAIDRAERRTAHLAARNLQKSYGEGRVIDGLSLTVGAGQRLAVIGDNGTGKSTLLRLLAGTLEPDAGSVACTTGRTLVEQELTADPSATVASLLDGALHGAREALAALDEAAAGLAAQAPDAQERYADALAAAEELDAWDARRRLEEDLDAFGAVFPEETPLRRLSPGQRYRLRLACALHDPAGAVLLDEPSNHLDDGALDRLAERVRGHRGITVLVTHDRWLLDSVATAMLDLDPTAEGGGALFGGSYPEFRAERERRMRRWRDRHRDSVEEEKRLVYRLAAARAQQPEQWRPEKGSGKHARSSRAVSTVRGLQRRLDQLLQTRPPAPPQPLRFALHDLAADGGAAAAPADAAATDAAATDAAATNAAVAGAAADGSAAAVTPAAEPLLVAEGLRSDGRVALAARERIELAPGSRLVVRGPNGAGKSTLLELLCGRLLPDAGTIAAGGSARVGLLAQEDDLDPAQTPLEALAGTRPDADEEELREAVAETGLFAERDLDRPLGRLSVGQRRRVDLARLVLERPSVLLLDEPTNHLSVTLVDDLTGALLETPAAVVLVTHDRTLLAAVDGWPTLRLDSR